MKTIVSILDFSEYDIRSQEEMSHWKELINKEISKRWKDQSTWIKISCPCCCEKNFYPAFNKNGFEIVECSACGSLYALFRPDENELRKWYRDSVPSKYWRDTILVKSDSGRTEKLVQPRTNWILDGITEYNPSTKNVIDISPHSRSLLEQIESGNLRFSSIIAGGITADLEGYKSKTILVKPSIILESEGKIKADVVIMNDVFNRASEPTELIRTIQQTLLPGGLLFLTAIVSSGFEIQALWEKSTSIIFPDKINLPSIEGLKILFAPPEWEVIELSTPGMFDVDHVYNAMLKEPKALWPRILKSLLKDSDIERRKSLIELLQSQKLTSFARLIIKKIK